MVTVQEPHPRIVHEGVDLDRGAHGFDEHRVLQGGVAVTTHRATHTEEVPVEVNRMAHHRPVRDGEPDVFPFGHRNGISVRIRLAVNRPRVAAHHRLAELQPDDPVRDRHVLANGQGGEILQS